MATRADGCTCRYAYNTDLFPEAPLIETARMFRQEGDLVCPVHQDQRFLRYVPAAATELAGHWDLIE